MKKFLYLKHTGSLALTMLLLTTGLITTLSACSGEDVPRTDDSTTKSDSAQSTTPSETESDNTDWITEPLALPEVSSAVLGYANVAPEGFALSNSTVQGEKISNLYTNDASVQTGFVSGNFSSSDEEAYLFIDLGRKWNINAVRLSSFVGYESVFPRSFSVQISEDFNEWTTVATQNADGMENGTVSISFAEINARYVRLQVEKMAEQNGSFCYAIGEMEVMAAVTAADNLVPQIEDIWMYGDSAVKLERKRLRIENTSADAALTFYITDSSVVKLSPTTGMLKAVGYGDTTVYLYDGTNLTPVHVRVIDDSTSETRISTFYHSTFGYPQYIPSCLDYMVEAGIGFLEETRAYDRASNRISDWMIHLCAERDIFYSVCDPLNSEALLTASDEEIVAMVKKYENRAGVGGIYLRDEPREDSNEYARIVRVIQTYNHHLTAHLNLLPPFGVPSWEEYTADFCAIASSGVGRFSYLSYDEYPFLWDGQFSNAFYTTLNKIRQFGLQYNISTGFYLQSFEITNAFRAPSDNELLLNASAGLAYGIKNFKWFVYLMPVDSGEGFTIGLLDGDFKPSKLYEGVKAANTHIANYGSILGNTDAIEVYQSSQSSGIKKVPSDFVLTQTTDVDAIYSLFRSLDDAAQQYVMVVNRDVTNLENETFTLCIAEDLPSLELWEEGSWKAVDISTHEVTLQIPSGDCVLFRLPNGYDARCAAERSEENLLLNVAPHVSSSQYTFSAASLYSASFLTDGNTKQSAWKAGEDDENATVLFDLNAVTPFSRVLLFPNAKSPESFPSSVVIEVSEDGKQWSGVSFTSETDSSTGIMTCTFSGISARYVRFIFSGKACTVGEIELYH